MQRLGGAVLVIIQPTEITHKPGCKAISKLMILIYGTDSMDLTPSHTHPGRFLVSLVNNNSTATRNFSLALQLAKQIQNIR
jgi:hypothetical protein